MEATINADGDLIIWPDTTLEAYALERWTQENIKNAPLPKMMIYGDIDAKERLDLKYLNQKPLIIYAEKGENWPALRARIQRIIDGLEEDDQQ
jgi:hypothetical protein